MGNINMNTNMNMNNGLLFFPVQVIRGRWFMLFASFLIMSGAGGIYIFGTYSEAIKASQGYDQSTLNLVSFFKNISLGILSGLVAEATPTWFVLLLGAAMNFGGYFMIWLAVTHIISKPKVWQMSLYIFIGASSQSFVNTGVLVPCVKNFPESRGVMMGLFQGYVGLSGAVITQLYFAIYGNNDSHSDSLILLIACLPSAILTIFLFTIRVIKVDVDTRPNDVKILYKLLYVSIALAIFIMVMIIVQRCFLFSQIEYIVCATVVCALLVIPLLVGMKEEFSLWNKKKKNDHPPPPQIMVIAENPQLPEPNPNGLPSSFSVEEIGQPQEPPEMSCFANIFNKPERGEDYTILQALLSIDMLLLIIGATIGLGASISAIDNLGQIGESLGYPSTNVSSFVSLVSIWNYFGRVFSGFVSEIFLQRYKVPRPLIWTLMLLLSCIGQLLITFPTTPGSAYAASIIIGFTYGAQFPVLNATVSELFGLKHFGTLFNCLYVASSIGSYAFNVGLAGLLYDREAKKLLKKSGQVLGKGVELTCVGTECFQLCFIIMASVTLFAALASLILVMRTREFYKTDIYKKFRDNNAIAATPQVAPSITNQEE